jgi:hypothetical protein
MICTLSVPYEFAMFIVQAHVWNKNLSMEPLQKENAQYISPPC